MKLNGSEIIVECLKEQGVDTVFGYPGGAILNVYDALYKHSDEITHILTSHEQGASHAADGYARATGKVGVCFATSGPGSYKPCYRYRNSLYGFNSGSCHHMQRNRSSAWESIFQEIRYSRCDNACHKA